MIAAAGAALGGETQESGLVRTASERVGEVAGTTRESARSHVWFNDFYYVIDTSFARKCEKF